VLDTPLSLITDIMLPNVRGLVAKRLRASGMSQSRIASLIGVTQPAVKQYLDGDEQEYKENLVKLGLSVSEIEFLISSISSLLSMGRGEETSAYITVFGLSNLSRLRFCEFHRRFNPSISPECRICQGFYRENEENELELAVSMIRNPEVAKLVPEVLSNLAFSKRNPQSVSDVIAVAGRIAVIGGIPTPASRPTWGGSRHLATILLRALKVCGKWRAVMNIKFDDRVEQALKTAGLVYSKVGPSQDKDDERIAQMVASSLGDCPDVVVHLGGNGIEPNAYVFGENPLEVATKVMKIAKNYQPSNGATNYTA